jgi:hypothetical protein
MSLEPATLCRLSTETRDRNKFQEVPEGNDVKEHETVADSEGILPARPFTF